MDSGHGAGARRVGIPTLLQRRRITGDELRELTGLAKKQGEKLTELFLQNGYVTEEDIDTLRREQKRFAFK